MKVRNGGQEAYEGSADDNTQVRHMFWPCWHHTWGGVKISAFGGTYVAMHECMHVAAMPWLIAMNVHYISITFSHLHATCNHCMSHAIHIANMLCVCVRAQNDF